MTSRKYPNRKSPGRRNWRRWRQMGSAGATFLCNNCGREHHLDYHGKYAVACPCGRDYIIKQPVVYMRWGDPALEERQQPVESPALADRVDEETRHLAMHKE